MPSEVTFPGNIVVSGNLRLAGSVSPLLARTGVLAITELQVFNVPWTLWRTFDAMGTNLPGAAATDDLGLVGGTHGSAHPTLQAGDVGGLNSTRYARAVIPLPWEYVSADSVTLRFYAGCLTAAPDTTCTLDVSCYICDGDTTLHADGDVAPAAVADNIKSTVFANVDFALSTTTNLSPGSELDVLLSIAYVDAGDAAVMIPTVGLVQLLCDVR
jgi:hypothetical protein